MIKLKGIQKKYLMFIPFQWWLKLQKSLRRNGVLNSRKTQRNIIQVKYLKNMVLNPVCARSAKHYTGSRMTNTRHVVILSA